MAKRLVQSGLAACVNQLDSVTSTYRWAGKLCEDAESLLIIKTSAAAYPQLQRVLTEIHPYELPEIVAVPISTGLPGYLDWICDNSAADPD